MHSHKCYNCGHVWRHGEECAGSETEHTCIKCRAVTWARYYESDQELIDEVNNFVKKILGI